jgi:UDPglucose 6-dehydrogenase
MRIAVIGTGYVGLVSGACFSEFGVEVTCVDQDVGKIARLQRNEMPIFEPGLDALVARNAAAGRLRFTTDIGPAVAGADAVFIAVGTPSRRGDGHADLSYVFAVAEEIGHNLRQYSVGLVAGFWHHGATGSTARPQLGRTSQDSASALSYFNELRIR